MFDQAAYDLIDLPVDRIFWLGNRVLPAFYPPVAKGKFIGNFELPFRHFSGVGTVAQWTGKFPVKLELAPSARGWFIMHRSACGHQQVDYKSKYAVPAMSSQLYIVSDCPRYLIPLETPVIIEFMYWLRSEAVERLSVINADVGFSSYWDVRCNLRKGIIFLGRFFTGNFDFIILAYPPLGADDTGNAAFVDMCRSYCAICKYIEFYFSYIILPVFDKNILSCNYFHF
jgi:hypothetical protein